MQRIAPVNLPYNVKTLWFDPEDVDVHPGDKVVVRTARGLEMGVVANDVFEVDYEEIKKLKSPLKPVERIATEEDERQAEKMEQLSREAMPIFKKLARETNEDMHPVSVEYMLDGDKAIFYFEAEERVDFRELVRKLASEFHVRIDMRQIGVRDEARIVGGIAHCGQLVCCKRLGGEFKPVSIRMAKDQDLSLNPQKISGLCGRLMCCLRYENAAYKEFKSKAPKLDAVIDTPSGEGKVTELDVPRETVTVRVADEKPVKLPLSAFSFEGEDRKHATVDPVAWDEAVAEAEMAIYETVNLLSLPKFTGQDKLGSAKAVHHASGEKEKSGSRKRRGGSGSDKGSGSEGHRRSRNRSHSAGDGAEETKRTPRRRSTKIKADGSEKETTVAPEGKPQKSGKGQSGASKGKPKQSRSGKPRGSGAPKDGEKKNEQGKLRPGHKSSGLAHDDAKPAGDGEKQGSGSGNRRRRRRRKPSGQGGAQVAQGAQGGSPDKPANAGGDAQ